MTITSNHQFWTEKTEHNTRIAKTVAEEVNG
jgi:hypothetical protein